MVDMHPRTSAARPATRAARLGARLLACALVLLPSAAAAQLRGQVSEDEITRQLLARARAGTATPASETPTTPYVPGSPGALPAEDEERARHLFGAPTTDADIFANPPVPPERPRGTRRRATEAEEPVRSRPRRETTDEASAEPRILRENRLDMLDEEANRRLAAENDRTGAIEGREREREDDPFAPLGLRLGTFNANASFEQGLTWTSNANSSPGGGKALLSETQMRLNAVSDWSRHSAAISGYGIVRRTISGEKVSEPELGLDASLNLDLAESWSARLGLGYSVRPESASSPVVIEDTVSRPLRHSLRADAGVTKELGQFRLGLTGNLNREDYADAELSGGGMLSQEERNFTLATVKLRAGYAVSPALTPFLETEIGRRFYDVRLDSSGYARSADRLALRGGVELDFGDKLRGELAAGWLREKIDDDRLAPLSGLSLEGALRWSPERDTIIALAGSTEVEGTTTAGESGSIRYAGDLSLERRIRANLTAGAALGAAWRDYAGSTDHELTLTAQANATWWFNRYAGLTGRLRHETFRSTLPGRDSRTDSVYLGLKLQR